MKPSILEKMCEWISSTFERSNRKTIEEYLSQATDLCDLERRIKHLEAQGTM